LSNDNSTEHFIISQVGLYLGIAAMIVYLISTELYGALYSTSLRNVLGLSSLISGFVFILDFSITMSSAGYLAGLRRGEEQAMHTIGDTTLTLHIYDHAEGKDWYEMIHGISSARVLRALWHVKRGRSFSRTDLADLLHRGEFERTRDAMLKHDLVRWKDESTPTLGVQFTSKGVQFLESVTLDIPRLEPKRK